MTYVREYLIGTGVIVPRPEAPPRQVGEGLPYLALDAEGRREAAPPRGR